MLTDTTGQPYAPPDVRRALKAIDPRLDLIHMKPPIGSGGVRQERGTWAFILRWPESDKRRAMIRSGQMREGADYDFLGAIPFDCPLEEARAYFEKFVTRFPADATNGVQLIRDRVNQWNTAQAEANSQDARELGLEILDAHKGNADFASSLGVGTVVTKAVGAGVAGSDVARRTGKSASELANMYMAVFNADPSHPAGKRVFKSTDDLKTSLRGFITAVESANDATPETIDGVAGLLLLRGEVAIQPKATQSRSEQSDRDTDFNAALKAQQDKKAAEDAASAQSKSATPAKPAPKVPPAPTTKK